MLAGLTGDEVQGHQGGVGDRFVEVPDDLGDRGGELLGGDDLDDVLDPDGGRGLGGDVDLRVPLALEAGGERQEVLVVAPRQRGDGGGVDTAGQERSDGDVGAHVLRDGVLQSGGDLVVAPLGVAIGDGGDGEGGFEVPLDHRLTAGGEGGVAPGLESPDASGEGLVLRDVLEGDVVLEGAGVEGGVDDDEVDQFGDGLLLAREHGSPGPGRHIQGLDAEGVAGDEERPLDGVPDGEGEHAAEPTDRGGAPVVEGDDDRFAVALGLEGGSVLAAQLVPELEVVVDLAVEHERVAVGLLRRAPAERLV